MPQYIYMVISPNPFESVGIIEGESGFWATIGDTSNLADRKRHYQTCNTDHLFIEDTRAIPSNERWSYEHTVNNRPVRKSSKPGKALELHLLQGKRPHGRRSDEWYGINLKHNARRIPGSDKGRPETSIG
ncbi:hypothetical protein BST61_g7791 [Cercospora zeina]